MTSACRRDSGLTWHLTASCSEPASYTTGGSTEGARAFRAAGIVLPPALYFISVQYVDQRGETHRSRFRTQSAAAFYIGELLPRKVTRNAA